MTNLEETEPVQFKEWRQREQKILQYLDDVTSNPLVEQEKILEHILKKNADTEYLRKYARNGATDAKNFRERVPVSDYDSYKPYIDRICEGDTSPILCADPVVEILRSSGTSKGQAKFFQTTEEDIDKRVAMYTLARPVRNRALPGLERGKTLAMFFTRQVEFTPGGLPCLAVATSIVRSSIKKGWQFDPTMSVTSAPQVFAASNSDEAMYCHLLLGLLQREEVLRFDAVYAATIQKAMRFLEESWQDISQDIANGTLHPRVKEDRLRGGVLPMLRKDPELADLVRSEFSSGKASDGFLRRLWPNAKAIDTICTGSMEAYLPALAHYSGNLPVMCTHLYAATEGGLGINMEPLCPPEKICYTLIPFSAYYEFIAVADAQNEVGPESVKVVDALSVKLGEEYEIVVTTLSGLYRYRMGDVLKVVGFYNSTPSFKFVRRLNTVLSVDMDKTDEKELHTAVRQGAEVLEQELGWRLLEYTSTVDFASNPAHYVIYWELVPSASSERSPTQGELEQCCTEMEANLNFVYRRGRHEGVVGALELRLLKEGSFNHLANHAYSEGASFAQYKTPRGIDVKRTAVLDLLNSHVSQKAFAPAKPPFKPQSFVSA